jgi:hypothetical protein
MSTMPEIRFYFDPASGPDCFDKLPEALLGCSYSVSYLPLAIGAESPLLRKAWGAAATGKTPSRYQLTQVFSGIETLQQDPECEAVSLAIAQTSASALASGLSELPAFELDGQLLQGEGALQRLALQLKADAPLLP